MKKLKSENGASISFALLLFLVCATAGAVVLAAGTAAAGRLSQMVNMDTRYYSASSAATLLVDEIAGKKVEIKKSLEEKVEETTTYDKDGKQTEHKKEYTLKYETNVNGTIEKLEVTGTDERPESKGSSISVSSSFLSKQACDLMFEGGTCNTDAALQKSFGLSSEKTMAFTLSGSDDLKMLNINGDAILGKDGAIDFEIKSEVEHGTYTIILHMVPDINETSSSSVVSEPSYSTGADGSYTEKLTTTETTTVTSTISWKVENIQKKMSEITPTPTPSGTP